MVVLLSSCSVDSAREWYDLEKNHMDLFGTVEIMNNESDRGGYYKITYREKTYYEDYAKIFKVTERYGVYEGDVLVSWESFPLGIYYMDKYYSYTKDDPIFIYTNRLNILFLNEDYDYLNDTFIIEGTNDEIVFSEAFLETDLKYDHQYLNLEAHQDKYQNKTDIVIYSKQCQRLRAYCTIFYENGVWYAGGIDTNYVFSISDEFLDLLMKNGKLAL